MKLKPEEYIAWDMYFASLASMRIHPGAGTKEHKQLTLDECRVMALEMIEIRRSLVEDT